MCTGSPLDCLIAMETGKAMTRWLAHAFLLFTVTHDGLVACDSTRPPSILAAIIGAYR